jgi:hypothetical protein
VDRRIMPLLQVNHTAGAKIGDRNGVVAAGVPDRPQKRRRRIEGVGVGAGMVAHIGAIQILHGGDVVQHRRIGHDLIGGPHHRGRRFGDVDEQAVGGAVVGHDRILLGSVRGVEHGIVLERMLEAQGVTEFVHQRHVIIAAHRPVAVVGGRRSSVDPDVATAGIARARVVGPAPGGRAVAGRLGRRGPGESDIADGGTAFGDARGADIGHIRPGLQGRERRRPLHRVEAVMLGATRFVEHGIGAAAGAAMARAQGGGPREAIGDAGAAADRAAPFDAGQQGVEGGVARRVDGGGRAGRAGGAHE